MARSYREAWWTGAALEDILDTVPIRVKEILEAHQQEGLVAAGSNAAYGFIGGSVPESITTIVSRAMSIYEKALYRNDCPSLLHSGGEVETERLGHIVGADALVVELAAAAQIVLPYIAKNPNKPTKNDMSDVSLLLANWGPQFAVE